MYFLYSVLTAAGMLLLAPYFVVKGLRQNKYLHNLRERLGLRFPAGLTDAPGGPAAPARSAIWLHAVSVGEVVAATPLARSLKERFPERRLLVSTTTATGQRVARDRVAFADAIFYFPLDWRGPVRRALDAARPGLIVIFETEMWPNFLREARRDGVPVVFVNGRLSDRSFQGYSRALRIFGAPLRRFLRRMLHDPALFLMQSAGDAERLRALGAPGERIVVTGNVKYDLDVRGDGRFLSWLEAEARRSEHRPLLIAGSVIAGEESAVLEAYAAVRKEWPNALLVLAPRKPERFDAAAELIEKSGRRVVRRSGLSLEESSHGVLACAAGERDSVLLLDTLGELAPLYSLADAVFVGGSLVNAGGHNPLEPAACGKVPVFGPSMQNFREIASGILEANAAIQVQSGAGLGAAWLALLADSERRTQMGERAREMVERGRGATAKTLEQIANLLPAAPGMAPPVAAEAQLGDARRT